jgi:hypothetical protein
MAQDLLGRLGFKDRQIKARGSNTSDLVKCDELNTDGTVKKHYAWTNIYKCKLMGDSPELMPLDRHLFNDVKYGCKLNVGATRWLPNEDARKFLFNTPSNAWKSICRTWEISPTSDRIIEDVDEFFTSVDEIVSSRGTFVDKNYHRGRRADLFKTAVPSASAKGECPAAVKKRQRCRTKEATMEEVCLHPDALWCLDKELELPMDDGIKGDGSSLASIEPVKASPTRVGSDELVRTTDLPIAWEEMHSLQHFAKRADALRAAKIQKKQEALREKEILKAKKAAAKAEAKAKKQAAAKSKKASAPRSKKPPTKKPRAEKKRGQAATTVHDELPPKDHVIEYFWPSGSSKGWFMATYRGERGGDDGEPESILEEEEGVEVNMCQISVADLDWRLLYPCQFCGKHTRGVKLCMKCHEVREVMEGDSSDDDSDY